jgi:hypothetical protein
VPSWTWNTVNNSTSPTRGTFFASRITLAGPGGDAHAIGPTSRTSSASSFRGVHSKVGSRSVQGCSERGCRRVPNCVFACRKYIRAVSALSRTPKRLPALPRAHVLKQPIGCFPPHWWWGLQSRNYARTETKALTRGTPAAL